VRACVRARRIITSQSYFTNVAKSCLMCVCACYTHSQTDRQTDRQTDTDTHTHTHQLAHTALFEVWILHGNCSSITKNKMLVLLKKLKKTAEAVQTSLCIRSNMKTCNSLCNCMRSFHSLACQNMLAFNSTHFIFQAHG
jgi:hypothetical protein